MMIKGIMLHPEASGQSVRCTPHCQPKVFNESRLAILRDRTINARNYLQHAANNMYTCHSAAIRPSGPGRRLLKLSTWTVLKYAICQDSQLLDLTVHVKGQQPVSSTAK